MKFEITDEQHARAMKWIKEEVYPKIVAQQRETFKNPTQFHFDCWDAGYPYEGAIGGGITYEFTPTSIGVVERVKYSTHNEEFSLDLTDYKSW